MIIPRQLVDKIIIDNCLFNESLILMNEFSKKKLLHLLTKKNVDHKSINKLDWMEKYNIENGHKKFYIDFARNYVTNLFGGIDEEFVDEFEQKIQHLYDKHGDGIYWIIQGLPPLYECDGLCIPLPVIPD